MLKKLLLTLSAFLLFSTSLHAVITDGKSYEFSLGDDHFGGYVIEDDNPGGFGDHKVKCFGESLYVMYGESMSLSFNPATKEPYYCTVEKKTHKPKGSLFGSVNTIIILTIYHSYTAP